MADGHLTFDTKIDDSALNKWLKSASGAFNTVKQQSSALKAEIKSQEAEVERTSEAYGKLKAQLDEWRSIGFSDDALDFNPLVEDFGRAEEAMFTAQTRLDGLKSALVELNAEAAKQPIVEEAKKEEKALEQLEDQAKETSTAVRQAVTGTDESGKPSATMKNGWKSTTAGFANMFKRLKNIALSALVFSVLYKGFNELKKTFTDLVLSNDELRSSLAQMKGALYTAFAPLWELILPYLQQFISWITAAATAVANFIAKLTGKTLSQSAKNAKNLYKQAKGYSAVGSAAAKATKSLASFDELNILSSGSSGSGGGGGGAGSGIVPDFDLDNVDMSVLDSLKNKLKEIWEYVEDTGAVDDLKNAWKDLKNAWKSIKDSPGAKKILDFVDKLIKIGAAVAVDQLASAFSVLADVLSALDGLFNGNPGQFLEGILDSFVDLSYMTISPITMLLDGIFGTNLTGYLKNAKKQFKDLDIAGFMNDVRNWFNEKINIPFFKWIKDTYNSISDFFGDIYNVASERWEKISGFFEDCGNIIEAVWTSVSSWFSKKMDDISAKTQGTRDKISKGFSDAWEKVKGIWGDVKSWFTTHVTSPLTGIFTGTWDRIKAGMKSLINWAISGIEKFLNSAIDGINKLTSGFNKVAKWAGDVLGENWNGIGSVKHVSLPRLAQGAVLPGGHAFAAIVNDQPAGQTNIEAPLDTIVAAMQKAIGTAGGTRSAELVIDKRVFAKLVYDMYRLESGRLGVKA